MKRTEAQVSPDQLARAARVWELADHWQRVAIQVLADGYSSEWHSTAAGFNWSQFGSELQKAMALAVVRFQTLIESARGK